MRMTLPALALLVPLLLPGGVAAKSFTSIQNPGQFRLAPGEFDAGATNLIDQLQSAYGPAPFGIAQVLADGNRKLSGLRSRANRQPGNPPAYKGVPVTRGYGWQRGDNLTGKWTPQGLTGSADAGISTPSQAVSWYRKGDADVRISFVNLAKRRYRHVLLVKPMGGATFDHVNIHAGGIAWIGHYLYVADTGPGLRVFDTNRILQVPKGNKSKAPMGYKYLLPQVGRYDSVGAKLTFSSVALDRQSSTLVVGEYRKGANAPIVSWPVDLSTGLLTSTSATAAYTSPFKQDQGVLTAEGNVLASSAATKRGQLYVGKPNQPATARNWGRSPEDLYRAEDGTIFSLTERKGERTVFGTPLAAKARLQACAPAGGTIHLRARGVPCKTARSVASAYEHSGKCPATYTLRHVPKPKGVGGSGSDYLNCHRPQPAADVYWVEAETGAD